MPTVLVVDDSSLDQRLVEGLLDPDPEMQLEFAENGQEALDRIKANPPDLVITDWKMPEMDGLELLSQVEREYPNIPVVLMTAMTGDEIAFEAVEKGARAYIPKTSLSRVLPGIVERLLSLSREKQELSRFLKSVTETESTFVLGDNDTSLISHLLEYTASCLRASKICPEGTEELTCLALEEALRNAVHHGNLELTSELREEEDDEAYTSLMEERRHSDPYKDRKVHVKITVGQDEAVFIVRDEGPGFDPSTLPDPTDPDHLDNVTGRGVWLMRSLMDTVEYNETGNQVTLTKQKVPDLDELLGEG